MILNVHWTYIVKFCVCFVCFFTRTLYHVLEYKKSTIAEHKSMPLLISINMFVLWFAWFSMNFSDPLRIALPMWLRIFGLLLFFIGAVLVVIAHLHIPGYGTKEARTTGIYSKLRHPMYFGFMLWLVGFPLFWQSIITLITAVLWVPAFVSWQILEEKQLEEKFPEYRAYKKQTLF